MLYYISKCVKCSMLQTRPYGQAVKTTPSHGVNSGSSPDKVTILAVFDRKIYQKPLFSLFFSLKIFRFWGSFGKEFLPNYPLLFRNFVVISKAGFLLGFSLVGERRFLPKTVFVAKTFTCFVFLKLCNTFSKNTESL